MKMLVKVFDASDCTSALIEGVRHYSDGTQLYVDKNDDGILEHVGLLSEAPAHVIAFLTPEKPWWLH